MNVPDNLDAFDHYDREQERQLDRLPKCADCGETVQSEHFYLINDEVICPDCLDRNYRKWVDDYVG